MLWCTQTWGSFPSHSVNAESLGHCSLYRYCEIETQCEKHWKITQIALKYLAKEIKLLKLIVAMYFILACMSEVFLLLKWVTLFLFSSVCAESLHNPAVASDCHVQHRILGPSSCATILGAIIIGFPHVPQTLVRGIFISLCFLIFYVLLSQGPPQPSAFSIILCTPSRSAFSLSPFKIINYFCAGLSKCTP